MSYRLKTRRSVGERFGSLPTLTPEVGFVDPRLRGLDLSGGGAAPQGGYDLAAARLAVTRGDPYDQVARREREIGRRSPLPYQTPSAMAGDPSLYGRPVEQTNIHQDLSSSQAVVPAHSVSGQRQTHAGSYGARTDTAGGPWWDARHRFGFGQMGSRGTGYSEEWDTPANRERRSGRLYNTTSFSQEVDPNWPWLRLRARGDSTVAGEGTYSGNALIRVTSGLHEGGGAEQTRTFWLGGGFTGNFDLKGWDQARIEILEILDGTFVEFAWSTEALPGDNSTLYFPQAYTTSGLVTAVPEGAYAVTIENPTPAVPGALINLIWQGRLSGAPFTFTQPVSDNSPVAGTRPNVYFGEPIPTLGPAFRIDTSVDLVWWLRTI